MRTVWEFGERYGRFREQQGYGLPDAGGAIVFGAVDRIWSEAGEHRKLAKAVAARVGGVLG